MTETYVSRLRLRNDVPLAALLAVMLGPDGSMLPHAGKALMWTLFAKPEGPRDFLWRENADKSFTAVSARPPSDPQGLFEILTSRPLDLGVEKGSELLVHLRCNPVVAGREGEKSKKRDVVMHALHKAGIGPGERGRHRDRLAHEAVGAWLGRQGRHGGFEFDGELTVVSSRHHAVPRGTERPLQFTSVDLDARIRVVDPDAFTRRLAFGYGSAKAYGCGLMMVAA